MPPGMKIESESRVHHPVEAVWALYRDELPLLAPLIPDVREIVIQERQELPGGLSQLSLWISDRPAPRIGGAPGHAHFQWEDRARWDEARRLVAWELNMLSLPGRVRCSGTTRFLADGPGACWIRLSGDLSLDLRGIPGVPGFLVGSITPRVEKAVIERLGPNLVRVNQALERVLDERAGL